LPKELTCLGFGTNMLVSSASALSLLRTKYRQLALVELSCFVLIVDVFVFKPSMLTS
jgi:hypothetical protein